MAGGLAKHTACKITTVTPADLGFSEVHSNQSALEQV